MRKVLLACFVLVAVPVAAQTPLPPNWNFMNAGQQAAWLCQNDPAHATTQCTSDVDKGPAVPERQYPANWNSMNADQQMQWRLKQWLLDSRGEPSPLASAAPSREIQRPWTGTSCTQAMWMVDSTRCSPSQRDQKLDEAVSGAFRKTPQQTFVTSQPPRCGRACGQLWTAEDFAASAQEIERLEREIQQLNSLQQSFQRRSAPQQPAYQVPRYTYQARPPVYQPRYTPPSVSNRLDGTTFYSGDVSGTATTISPFTYYNFTNGVSGTSQNLGPFTYYNFQNQRGGSLNGTTQHIGPFDYHNFDNGVSGTSQTIGPFKYSNFSDGKTCTTQTIGTFTYTNCY